MSDLPVNTSSELDTRDALGRVLPGAVLNPAGRPRGSVGGRALALLTLDKMMAKEANLELLFKALEADFLKDPIRFFKTIIMPTAPTDVKMAIVGTVAPWPDLKEMIIRKRELEAQKKQAIDVPAE